MDWKNAPDRFGTLSIAMHWLMLLMIIGVYAAINLHDIAPKGSDLRADLKLWHFAFGIGILALVVVRIAARLAAGPAPAITPAPSHWQELAARAMHAALYAFLLGMPLLGWIAVSAKGAPIEVIGLRLPALIGPDKELYDTLKDIHEVIGTAGYYLVGLHAAAALFHHYVMRDDTLRRMLPARR
jgi:cytochrome b561